MEIKNICMSLNSLGIQVQSIGMQLSSNINSNFGTQLGNIGIQISSMSMNITNKVTQMIDMMNQMQNNLMNNNNMMNQMENNLMNNNNNMMNQMQNNLMNNNNMMNQMQNNLMYNNMQQNFIMMNKENNFWLNNYKNDENKNKYTGYIMNIYFKKNNKLESIVAYSDMSIENLIKAYLKKYNIIEYLKSRLENDDKEYLNEENIDNILWFLYNAKKIDIKDQEKIGYHFNPNARIDVNELQLYNCFDFKIIEIWDVKISTLRNDYKFYHLGKYCLPDMIKPLISKSTKEIEEKLDDNKKKSKEFNEYYKEIKEKIDSYFDEMSSLDFLKKGSVNNDISKKILNEFKTVIVEN